MRKNGSTMHPRAVLAAAVLALSSPLHGRAPEGWDCRFCPEAAPGDSAQLTLGFGHASDRPRFASDPLGSAASTGALGWLDGQWQHRDADGRLLRIDAAGLGLANPGLQLQDLQPGRYSLMARWQELVHQPGPAGSTPFETGEGNRLQLPPGWVAGGSPAQMSALPASLRPHGPIQQRRWLDLSAGFVPAAAWRTHADYRREERAGSRWTSGAFLTQSTWLPQPVDMTTDRLDLGAEYHAKHWLASLGYGLSLFRNAQTGLRWDNAYSPLRDGADAGELAVAPDNQAHQLSLAAHYFGHPLLRMDGSLAVGRLLQDEPLLAASVNPALLSAPPRRSAQARIDTVAAQLRGSYRVGRPLRLELRYRHQDRDTRTPSQDFVQVLTDNFLSDSRRNLPYAFRDDLLAAQADYRPRSLWRLRLGLEQERRERDAQARRRTQETRGWGEWRLRTSGPIQLSARLGYAERDGSAFEQPQDVSVQNSRQRAFNLTDRERRDGRLRLEVFGSEGLHLSLQAELADEDYDASSIGLQAARHASLSAQLSGGSDATLLWLVHASHAQARLEQAGSQALALADWWAASRDLHDSYGLSLNKAGLLPRVDVQLDYAFSRSHGRIQVRNDDFPELRTRLHGLDLRAIWHWRPRLDWDLRYRYERYQDADWQYDNLSPDSLGNVLGPGTVGYNKVLHLLGLSLTYRF